MERYIRTTRASILLLIAIVSVACSPNTPTLVRYERSGVSFAHFSDWKVTSDAIVDKSAGSRSINLEGPKEALISVVVLPASIDMTLDAFATSIARERAEAIKQSLSIGSYSSGQTGATSSQPVSGEVSGKRQSGIRQTFSLRLLGHEVPHEAKFFLVTDPQWTAFIFTQVATEHATQVEPGFSATLGSFRLGGSR